MSKPTTTTTTTIMFMDECTPLNIEALRRLSERIKHDMVMLNDCTSTLAKSAGAVNRAFIDLPQSVLREQISDETLHRFKELMDDLQNSEDKKPKKPYHKFYPNQ